VPLPSMAPPIVATEQSAQQPAWWASFNDPQLSSLLERGRSSNLDLRLAVLRIQEARAQRDVRPRPTGRRLSADASFSRQRLSDTTPTGSLFNSLVMSASQEASGSASPIPTTSFSSAPAPHGRSICSPHPPCREAADAGVEVSVEDQRAVLVSVWPTLHRTTSNCGVRQSRLLIARTILPPRRAAGADQSAAGRGADHLHRCQQRECAGQCDARRTAAIDLQVTQSITT